MTALSLQGKPAHKLGVRRFVAVTTLIIGLLAALAGVKFLATQNWHEVAPSNHFADAEDVGSVQRGAHIYKSYCASCHGRYLQGQPFWQLGGAYSRQLAVPLDPKGSAWRHPDEELFNKIKYSAFSGVTKIPDSNMPAFKTVLNDQDILAVIAFVKARWPLGLRVLQARQNPGFAGMPATANSADWTIPPECTP